MRVRLGQQQNPQRTVPENLCRNPRACGNKHKVSQLGTCMQARIHAYFIVKMHVYACIHTDLTMSGSTVAVVAGDLAVQTKLEQKSSSAVRHTCGG